MVKRMLAKCIQSWKLHAFLSALCFCIGLCVLIITYPKYGDITEYQGLTKTNCNVTSHILNEHRLGRCCLKNYCWNDGKGRRVRLQGYANSMCNQTKSEEKILLTETKASRTTCKKKDQDLTTYYESNKPCWANCEQQIMYLESPRSYQTRFTLSLICGYCLIFFGAVAFCCIIHNNKEPDRENEEYLYRHEQFDIPEQLGRQDNQFSSSRKLSFPLRSIFSTAKNNDPPLEVLEPEEYMDLIIERNINLKIEAKKDATNI